MSCFVEIRSTDDRKHGEQVDRALKELKRQMKKEGVLEDFQLKQAYMSPSKKRRFKRNEAFKRRKREERKQDWYSKKNPEGNESLSEN